ncbi:MAG: hypothetical protein ACLRIS_21340 [Flavonifractor plautii]
MCGACGGRLTAKRTRRPDGREYLRFVCRGRGTGCAMRAVPGDVLTACVRHVLGEVGLPLGAMAVEVLASARPAGRSAGRRLCGRPSAVRRPAGPGHWTPFWTGPSAGKSWRRSLPGARRSGPGWPGGWPTWKWRGRNGRSAAPPCWTGWRESWPGARRCWTRR